MTNRALTLMCEVLIERIRNLKLA